MSAPEPTRLARRLDTLDAVVVGLGAMLGAGVFAAVGPAALAAGNGLVIGLGLAAVVAFCNATSTAQLAALYPESGGAYVYGRRRLGAFWGFLAGWGFVVGKLASCAAMAMTLASYAAPTTARPVAIVAVITLVAINYRGVQKTAAVTKILVALVLCTLAIVLAAVWGGGATAMSRLWPLAPTSVYGVLQSAGLLFFAFAGYARLATLGEEVIDSRRTIPRAIPIALGIVFVVYTAVAVTAIGGVELATLATSTAPLAAAVEQGRWAALAPAVRVGAALASASALLSLIVGISRTVFAMASARDLPTYFAAVHPRFAIPHRAELAVGAIIIAIVTVADLRGAIGFSSFAVLAYYAIANAAAWTLSPTERRWPRALSLGGLVGCLVLAATLPWRSALGGALVLALGMAIFALRARHESDPPPETGAP